MPYLWMMRSLSRLASPSRDLSVRVRTGFGLHALGSAGLSDGYDQNMELPCRGVRCMLVVLVNQKETVSLRDERELEGV